MQVKTFQHSTSTRLKIHSFKYFRQFITLRAQTFLLQYFQWITALILGNKWELGSFGLFPNESRRILCCRHCEALGDACRQERCRMRYTAVTSSSLGPSPRQPGKDRHGIACQAQNRDKGSFQRKLSAPHCCELYRNLKLPQNCRFKAVSEISPENSSSVLDVA